MAKKIQKKLLFRGFSSANNNQSVLSDIEITKQDLINHFQTKKTERVMYPNFGSIIWDRIFDQFGEFLRDEIIEDSKQIVNSDSRVQLIDIIVDEFEHGIILQLEIEYRPFGVFESFSISFDRRTLQNPDFNEF